jgi:glycosyltransferase involved in cell wall biosynthesis
LESVKCQTYKNIEIILVDDGSDDRSAEICDSYAEDDGRFKVYHIKNEGVANARNYALDRFQGEYCIFVDSDDYVLPEYVERLFLAVEESGIELATCHTIDIVDKDIVNFEKIMGECQPVIISLENYDFLARYAHFVSWGAIYSKNIIEKIRFPKDFYVGEDTVFFAMALENAGAVADIQDKLYCYVHYEQSLSNGEYNERKYSEVLAWKRVCEIFEDQNEKFNISCKAAMSLRCFWGIKRAAIDSKLNEWYCKELISTLRQNWLIFIKSNVTIKYKVSYTWLCIAAPLYLKLYRMHYTKKNINLRRKRKDEMYNYYYL